MAILVTGIGYLGSALARRLLSNGEEVVGIDNCFSTDRQAIGRLQASSGFRFVEGSVTDPEAVKRAFECVPGIQVVYHLAAQASAHPQAASPDYTEITNLSGPRVVLDAMLDHGARTFVFGSSFRVYGPFPQGKVDESSPYGSFGDLSHLSKCYVEKLMEMYSNAYGLDCLPVRIGVVYGVAPVTKTDYRFMTAPNKFCLQAARGETLNVSAGGSASTGFISVEDAVESMIIAARSLHGYSPANAVTEARSVSWLARQVQARAVERGLSVNVNCDASAEPDEDFVPQSVLDRYGFQPKWSLATAVPHMLDHFVRSTAGEL